MYGFILDSMVNCIKHVYGNKTWQSVVGNADISSTVFTTHKIYDEQLIPMIAKATSDITGIAIETVMETAGKYFINYIDQIRNDRITKVLGRTFKDFLIGLDCMHEYYRTNFNEIQPPSFHVAKEDSEGLEIQYRSRRTFTGFMYYVQGLLQAIAEEFYSIDVAIQITQHGFTGDAMLAVYRLNYLNTEFATSRQVVSAKRAIRSRNDLHLPMNAFFELFPFHVVFNEGLLILSTGHGLDVICKGLQGRRLNETFFMTRPLGYDLTWDNVLIHADNVFELTSVKSTGRPGKSDETFRGHYRMPTTHFIKLRGQMLHIEEWGLVIFLATLMMDDLNKMHDLGTFVNDLTFHDLSRDMVLHGPQQTTEYKLALDLEQGKNSRLEEMIENLGNNQRKIDDLLYSMIPKEIAKSLREGNTSVSLCEKYEDVTILFSDVVNFANICKHVAPHEIMKTLNSMVSVFDKLCEKHNTYKVETVADGFMCVSGAPNYDEFHARNMADMAIEMQKNVHTVYDPHSGKSIKIRIGLHCGAVIAGLVGHKIPRYCLFGETVHIASKLEATGMGDKIHVSQKCMEYLLPYNRYQVIKSGEMVIKGQKNITTYWIEGMNVSEFDNGSDVEQLAIKDRMEQGESCETVIYSSIGAVRQEETKLDDVELASNEFVVKSLTTYKDSAGLPAVDGKSPKATSFVPLDKQVQKSPKAVDAVNPLEIAVAAHIQPEPKVIANQSPSPENRRESTKDSKKSEVRQSDQLDSSDQASSDKKTCEVSNFKFDMDTDARSAYNNLMKSVGINSPLDVIILNENTVLSKKPKNKPKPPLIGAPFFLDVVGGGEANDRKKEIPCGLSKNLSLDKKSFFRVKELKQVNNVPVGRTAQSNNREDAKGSSIKETAVIRQRASAVCNLM